MEPARIPLQSTQKGRPTARARRGPVQRGGGAFAPLELEGQMRRIDLRIGLAALLAAVALPAAASAQRPLALEIRGGINRSVLDLNDGIGLLSFPNGEPAAAAEDWGWSGSADMYWRFARRSSAYIGWNRTKFDCKEE